METVPDRTLECVRDRAAATHRQAAALASAVGAVLADAAAPQSGTGAEPPGRTNPGLRATPESDREPSRPDAAAVADLTRRTARAREAASRLAPGWLSAPFEDAAALPVTDSPPAEDGAQALASPPRTPGQPGPRGVRAGPPPVAVRLGTALPGGTASFPAVVPLGHLTLDRDARDPRVAAVLQATVVRLLAAAPGQWLVRAVDPGGEVTAPLAGLVSAGVLAAPPADHSGLRAVVREAEGWAQFGAPASGRRLLVLLTGWPSGTDADRARLTALAEAAPAAGLHLLAAGWGAPASTAAALPHATAVTVGAETARLGALPTGPPAPAGIGAPVRLDPAPSPALTSRVSRAVAQAAVDRARRAVAHVLPAGTVPTDTDAAGTVAADPDGPPSAVVGTAEGAPVAIQLGGVTGHWLVTGGAGTGKTSLLQTVCHGLTRRYPADRLTVMLLTADDTTAARTSGRGDAAAPDHLQIVRGGADLRRYLPVLRQLVAWSERPATPDRTAPRVVCLVDDADRLVGSAGTLGTEAATMLRTLARDGGGNGIHLVVAGRTPPPDAVATHIRVRIALPGGGAALDPANRAAETLPTGLAVINTAGGLGGPRGAARAHEQRIRLLDPYDVALAAGVPGGEDTVPTARRSTP